MENPLILRVSELKALFNSLKKNTVIFFNLKKQIWLTIVLKQKFADIRSHKRLSMVTRKRWDVYMQIFGDHP